MPLIDDILQEFPDLAPRKDEIARILAAMERAGPPPAQLDDAFVAQLRTELMSRDAMNDVSPLGTPAHPFFSFMQQKTFALVTAVIAIALVVPAGYALWKINQNGGVLAPGGDTSLITVLDAGAFGDLSEANAVSTADGKGGSLGSDKAMSESLIAELFPYEPTVYVYTYEGDLSSYLGDATGTVYERQTFGALAGSSLSDISSRFSRVNIDKFLDGELTSFVLKANGYMLSVDAPSNMWSMYRDWTSYTFSEEWTPMTADDLPTDDAILSVAASFVNQWGIDTSGYGSPVIGESEIALAREGAANIYIPESATVIYPVLVEGNEVYPAWTSAPTGLRISVNLRDLSVTNAYDALTQSYNASTYDLTQDAELVEKLIAGGGTGPVLYEGIAIHEVIVSLNDPERVLMEYSLYEDGQSRTLFIPALRFTLEDSSDIPWTSGVVTVPLVKDIAEAQTVVNDNVYILDGVATGEEPMVK